MLRISPAAILLVFASGVSQHVPAVASQSDLRTVQLAQPSPQDSPPRHRPPTRLRVYRYYETEGVYPHFYPGPDAVRACRATYVQEYRPSGTVIVPRMSCYWTQR